MKREPWKETDVAEAAMSWLADRGWDCYPEAQLPTVSGRADIAARIGNRLAIVEAKVCANLAVLDQAARWLGRAHHVWIATPQDPGNTVRWVCSTRGIGIMVVHRRQNYGHRHDTPAYDFMVGEMTYHANYWRNYGGIQQSGSTPAPLHRRALAGPLLAGLHEDMKRATAGSQPTRGSYSTPWSRTIDEAKAYVARNPGCSMRELVAAISHHYASDAGARSTLMQWLPRFARIEEKKLFPLT